MAEKRRRSFSTRQLLVLCVKGNITEYLKRKLRPRGERLKFPLNSLVIAHQQPQSAAASILHRKSKRKFQEQCDSSALKTKRQNLLKAEKNNIKLSMPLWTTERGFLSGFPAVCELFKTLEKNKNSKCNYPPPLSSQCEHQ